MAKRSKAGSEREAAASQEAGAETPRCAESQSAFASAGGRRRDADRAASRELNDARDQLVAMSEVLHAISRSKFELPPCWRAWPKLRRGFAVRTGQ